MGIRVIPFPDPNMDRVTRPWTRKVEERIQALETQAARQNSSDLNTNKGQNAALGAQARNVRSLAEQQDILDAQVVFLQTQKAFASNSSEFTDISSGLTDFSYDPSYDLSITIHSGQSGKLFATVSAWLYGFERAPVLGVEAFWDGGSITFDSTDYRRHATGKDDVASTREYLLDVPADTDVTVRSRRGATNGNVRQITISRPTLSLLRLA